VDINGENLKIGYGGAPVIKDMTIRIKPGVITSIIGPNGSGKSTVLKALTRLLPCQGGQIFVDGRDLKELAAREFAKLVGVLPQVHSAPPDFQVKELVGYGRVPYRKWYERNKEEDERIIDWAMKATGVWELREKCINECSGGECQRVWIATVLTQQPQILFLDEPTTYLDISHQLEMMQLVKKLNREDHIGVVMVLHDLSQALEVSDWIVIIKEGRKYAEGRPEDVITRKMMKEVYDVDCDILKVPGRSKPLIAYRELA
jgi:ABC-type cobalamin/Fe3+-siderophores transport systems, ATPase components